MAGLQVGKLPPFYPPEADKFPPDAGGGLTGNKAQANLHNFKHLYGDTPFSPVGEFPPKGDTLTGKMPLVR